MDYRKTLFEQWMLLEEHALAVASTLIWGMNVRRKGVLGFHPGQTWLRTSLEIVPIQPLLDQKVWQVYAIGDAVKAEHSSWALASFFGEVAHQLLDLKDESVDFFSFIFGSIRYQRQPRSNSTDLDPRLEIMMGLAHVEWEEQNRVRMWHSMTFTNVFHPKALSVRNELSLGPCWKRKGEQDRRLCPSIVIDMDQSYLLHAMMEEPTKDMAATLCCELTLPATL